MRTMISFAVMGCVVALWLAPASASAQSTAAPPSAGSVQGTVSATATPSSHEASARTSPTDPLLLRYRRMKRAGWWLTGLSVAGFVLTTVIYTEACHCGADEWLCFCQPAFGAALGATIFGGPFIAGLVTASVGTARLNHYRAEHPVVTRLQVGVGRNRFVFGYRF